MNELIAIKDLWTAAGVLLGFQATAFYWRITRESGLSTAKGDTSEARESNSNHVWLAPADYLNMVAMLIIVIGLFIAPALGMERPYFSRFLIGLSALLYIGHTFALAGHYELYGRGHERSFKWFPSQEKIALTIVTFAILLFSAIALCIHIHHPK